jgi:hypothetical protein
MARGQFSKWFAGSNEFSYERKTALARIAILNTPSFVLSYGWARCGKFVVDIQVKIQYYIA